MAILIWAVTTRTSRVVNAMMAIAGCGTGLRFMPNNLHAAGIWPTRIAAAMSIIDFALPFGGTLAIAIMGSVFNNKWAQAIATISPSAITNAGKNVSPHNTQSLSAINALPPSIQSFVREKAAKAVMWAFISIMPIMGFSVLAAAWLGNVWINSRKNKDNVGTDEKSKSYVMYGSFLLALLKGDVEAKKVPRMQTGDEEGAVKGQEDTEGDAALHPTEV
jgi:hypothetical protein